MVLKNRSNEIRTNEIRIRREPSVYGLGMMLDMTPKVHLPIQIVV